MVRWADYSTTELQAEVNRSPDPSFRENGKRELRRRGVHSGGPALAAPMASNAPGTGPAPSSPVSGPVPGRVPWYNRVPRPVLYGGAAAVLAAGYFLWKKRQNTTPESGLNVDGMGVPWDGRYQYTPGLPVGGGGPGGSSGGGGGGYVPPPEGGGGDTVTPSPPRPNPPPTTGGPLPPAPVPSGPPGSVRSASLTPTPASVVAVLNRYGHEVVPGTSYGTDPADVERVLNRVHGGTTGWTLVDPYIYQAMAGTGPVPHTWVVGRRDAQGNLVAPVGYSGGQFETIYDQSGRRPYGSPASAAQNPRR